ncbi:hypothetical protein MMC18_003210 [Xylographa bjoerkii]|nr:hypothetical protein [Xylographa bjoerkii]
MASYMSRQHEVGKKSYDFSTLDLFQPLDPYFGYPGDNGTETGLDNGSQDFASPSCPKTPQLANSAIRTDSPRDRSPANPCDLDLGIDLPSPTWLDDFLAEIDPARDWEPSRFTQSLDTGFSQCSGRRTGGSGSSIRNCSNNILERRSTISPLFSFRLDSLRGIGDWLVTSSVRNPDTEELNAELLNGKSLTQENQLLLSAPRPEIPFLVQAREDIQFIVTSIDHHFGVTNAIQAGSQPTSTWVDSSGFRGDSERIPTDDKAERLNLWLRELPRLFGHSGESEVALHEPRLVLLEPARLHIEAVLPEVSLETRTFVKDSNLPQKLAITKKQQLRPTRRSQKQQAHLVRRRMLHGVAERVESGMKATSAV